MSLSKFSIRALVLMILAAFFVSTARAQFKASIQGTVMDPQGNAVAVAKVTITNQDTGVVRDTVSSAEGFYRISELPPGKYTVTIEAAGFKQSVSKERPGIRHGNCSHWRRTRDGERQRKHYDWNSGGPHPASIRQRSVRIAPHGARRVRRQRTARQWKLVPPSSAGWSRWIGQRNFPGRKPGSNRVQRPARNSQQLHARRGKHK